MLFILSNKNDQFCQTGIVLELITVLKMDDLLLEFLTETNESLDVVDVELVKFEQEPNNAGILDNIFRLVHTIKGTCGFLGLPRLESLAHAAETLMGKFRDGTPVTSDAVSVTLASIDRIKAILGELEASGREPNGDDHDLIDELDRMAGVGAYAGETSAVITSPVSEAAPSSSEELVGQSDNGADESSEEGEMIFQILERELKPGEVSLDDLERAFRETEGPAEGSNTEAKEAAAAAVSALKAAEKSKAGAAVGKIDTGGAPAGSVSNQSIRVAVDTLEHLMTMVSELVLTRNQLLEIVRRHEDSEFKVPLQRLSNVTAELQEGVMKTRMQPIGNAWQKLPRVVRDLACDLDKNIELEMIGAETELDRQVLDLIKDPLTHMVRNSADHGLETTQGRKEAGKNEKGTIRLSAYHEGGHIIIEIADDGRGLNADKLKNKILETGLASEAELGKMTEAQIHKFIFHAGFSTAAKVTNVSGRGVGMDVVRNNIELIGGTIDLKSVWGKGTTFTIKIPLTLAIVSTLIVESAKERFAIPQLAVVELVRVQSNSENCIERIKDTPVLRLRNKLLPLLHLKQVLMFEDVSESEIMGNDDGFIVVMQVGNQNFGVVVDAVFHTEEIVVKPMSSMLRHLTMFSGNTILGDGSVIMIIDPNGIAQVISSQITEDLAEIEGGDGSAMVIKDEAVSFLLFSAGSKEPKAVPLSLVTRLEEVKVENIESSNGRELVQYRGSLMPLVYVNDETELRQEGLQPLLVFADDEKSMGLVVDEIVDIVEDHLDIEVSSNVPGILGSAVIKGRATEVIDVGHFLPFAFNDWFKREEMKAEALTRSVLFVDDSSFFRNMLVPVLKAAGYRVLAVENAAEALETLSENPHFDIIISDIEMPGMNGYEMTESIRRIEQFRELPIIALSSLATPAAVERARQSGFSDYVAKFDRSGLIAALKEHIVDMDMAA